MPMLNNEIEEYLKGLSHTYPNIALKPLLKLIEESVEQARQEGLSAGAQAGRDEIIDLVRQYINDKTSGYDALAHDSFEELKALTVQQGSMRYKDVSDGET